MLYNMDSIFQFEEISMPQVMLYAALSFVIVVLLGFFIYITCTKKYRLNWFENNLLETAKEREYLRQSQEALVESAASMGRTGSLRSLRNGSPISLGEDPAFWVPNTLQRQSSLIGDMMSSADESMPNTPSSPTSSNKSLALSTNSMPIARSDKHVVLTNTSPARPKVASMQAKLDHTKIDMTMYNKPPPKDTTTRFQPTTTHEEPKGIVHLLINYDPEAGLLTIRLLEAQNLQPRTNGGTADPYAKVRLLPDKSKTYQTRIHKKTLNPVFDEDFIFEVRPATIGRRTLEVQLFDFDSYSRHISIGRLRLDLAHVDLADRVQLWKELASCADQDAKVDLGDLKVTVTYLASAERLTVNVLKARNLRVVDDSRNSSDPFVKVSLVYNNKRLKKKKTTVFRNNINPVFNEAFTFDVPKDMIKKSLIEFLVLHDSLLGANELLGRAVVGNSSDIGTEERKFFLNVLRSNVAITEWVPLSDPKSGQQRTSTK